mmetsp:Transcript_29994/g.72009  ORF Transcript_29994/g.72009 Transcript_29994/m.72009 type:complete len:156 (-) Transcript_29994:17-484(-)
MLRRTLACFGNKFKPGRATDLYTTTRFVRAGQDVSEVFRDLSSFSKKKGISKRTFLIHDHEKRTRVRWRLHSERIYFARWHYMKYCLELIKHGIANELPLGARVQRLYPYKFYEGEEPTRKIRASRRQRPSDTAARFSSDELRSMAVEWHQTRQA